MLRFKKKFAKLANIGKILAKYWRFLLKALLVSAKI
jgi:hypothetical protein